MNKKIIMIIGIIILGIIFSGIWYLKNTIQIVENNNESTCTDSDNGKNIHTKGSAIYKDTKGITIHITGDSCAIKNEKKQAENEADYIQGLPLCTGDNCYVLEGYCDEYEKWGHQIDAREFIKCPNGCNDGACISMQPKKD